MGTAGAAPRSAHDGVGSRHSLSGHAQGCRPGGQWVGMWCFADAAPGDAGGAHEEVDVVDGIFIRIGEIR